MEITLFHYLTQSLNIEQTVKPTQVLYVMKKIRDMKEIQCFWLVELKFLLLWKMINSISREKINSISNNKTLLLFIFLITFPVVLKHAYLEKQSTVIHNIKSKSVVILILWKYQFYLMDKCSNVTNILIFLFKSIW